MSISGTKKASTASKGAGDFHCLGVALDEGHVLPAVPLDLLLCYLKHLRAELHPDNPSLGPDALLKHIEAEARATAEIENGLAGLEVQASDGVVADAIRKTLPLVVFGGVASVAVFLGLGVVGVHMGDYTLSQIQIAGRVRLCVRLGRCVVRRLVLPGCPCHVGAAKYVVPALQVGDGGFQDGIRLASAEHPADDAPDPDPSPGPEPRLEIEIKQWTQGPAGVPYAGRHKSAAGRKRVQGSANGGGRIEDLGYEEGQCRIEGAGDVDGVGIALDEGHVAPAVELDPPAGHLEHLGAEFHADDASMRADVPMKPFKAYAGAASEVEHRFAGLEIEVFEGGGADPIEKAHGAIVISGEAAVTVLNDVGVGGVHVGDYSPTSTKEKNPRPVGDLVSTFRRYLC